MSIDITCQIDFEKKSQVVLHDLKEKMSIIDIIRKSHSSCVPLLIMADTKNKTKHYLIDVAFKNGDSFCFSSKFSGDGYHRCGDGVLREFEVESIKSIYVIIASEENRGELLRQMNNEIYMGGSWSWRIRCCMYNR